MVDRSRNVESLRARARSRVFHLLHVINHFIHYPIINPSFPSCTPFSAILRASTTAWRSRIIHWQSSILERSNPHRGTHLGIARFAASLPSTGPLPTAPRGWFLPARSWQRRTGEGRALFSPASAKFVRARDGSRTTSGGSGDILRAQVTHEIPKRYYAAAGGAGAARRGARSGRKGGSGKRPATGAARKTAASAAGGWGRRDGAAGVGRGGAARGQGGGRGQPGRTGAYGADPSGASANVSVSAGCARGRASGRATADIIQEVTSRTCLVIPLSLSLSFSLFFPFPPMWCLASRCSLLLRRAVGHRFSRPSPHRRAGVPQTARSRIGGSSLTRCAETKTSGERTFAEPRTRIDGGRSVRGAVRLLGFSKAGEGEGRGGGRGGRWRLLMASVNEIAFWRR